MRTPRPSPASHAAPAPRLSSNDHRPHHLEGRLGPGPESDLTRGLVHEHAEAVPDRGALTLGRRQKRRHRRIVNEVNDELASTEPGRIDPGDDGAAVLGRPRQVVGLGSLDLAAVTRASPWRPTSPARRGPSRQAPRGGRPAPPLGPRPPHAPGRCHGPVHDHDLFRPRLCQGEHRRARPAPPAPITPQRLPAGSKPTLCWRSSNRPAPS